SGAPPLIGWTVTTASSMPPSGLSTASIAVRSRPALIASSSGSRAPGISSSRSAPCRSSPPGARTAAAFRSNWSILPDESMPRIRIRVDDSIARLWDITGSRAADTAGETGTEFRPSRSRVAVVQKLLPRALADGMAGREVVSLPEPAARGPGKRQGDPDGAAQAPGLQVGAGHLLDREHLRSSHVCAPSRGPAGEREVREPLRDLADVDRLVAQAPRKRDHAGDLREDVQRHDRKRMELRRPQNRVRQPGRLDEPLHGELSLIVAVGDLVHAHDRDIDQMRRALPARGLDQPLGRGDVPFRAERVARAVHDRLGALGGGVDALTGEQVALAPGDPL